MTIKILNCTKCKASLGEIDGPNNRFTPDKTKAKMIYCMGGICIVGCIQCGVVQIMVVENINET